MVCRKNPDLPHTALRARLSLIPRFPAIHLTRQSPFYKTPRHIGSRDGIDLCPSSDPNPSRQHSRAHPLARWFAGRSPTCHTRPCRPCIPLSCNSSCTAIAILRACRAHPLARWFAGRSSTYHRAAKHSPQCLSRTLREIHSNLYRCE